MAAEYRLTEWGVAIRLSDGAYIPTDPGNADRKVYESYVAEGGEVEPTYAHQNRRAGGYRVSL